MKKSVRRIPRPCAPFCFNTEDAAYYIGVKVSTLREWGEAGTIKPHQKDGKHLFWLRSELEKFVAELPVRDNLADRFAQGKKV